MNLPLEMKWVVSSVDAGLQQSLSRALGLSPVLAQILVHRGFDSIDAAKAFLRPELDQLHDPSLLPGMTRAAERIVRAIEGEERIVIYGDYDVDGITATALLLQCFRLAGANVGYYIPERLDEGYGLNADAVNRLKAEGAQVIVTVDCGVSAVGEAKAAAELGLTLIITDHHEPGPQLPEAHAVVDPKLEGSGYPFTELSGVGVAFKLAWAIGQTFSRGKRVSEEFREFLLKTVALAALGTIADVVPLQGENRVLAKFGLIALENTESPGIRALMAVAGLDQKRLSARDVAFGLGPRINAAGRLGSADRAIDLLMADSYPKAQAIAAELDKCNRERQEIGRGILAAAEAKIESEIDLAAANTIVLADSSWHFGVVGIVASKIAEKYYRPTIMFALEGDVARGSARSIPPFHLYNGLRECRDYLLGFGGHAQAAGVHVQSQRVCDFALAFDSHAGAVMHKEDLVPALGIDAEVTLDSVNEGLAGEIERLMPFGHGNREPILAAVDVSIAGKPRRVGSEGRHLSLFVRQGATSFRAIAFGMGELIDQLEAQKDGWAIAFVPKINEWNGKRNLELEIKDIQSRA